MTQRRATFVFLTVLPVGLAAAGDWPSFRGPNHDGISSETGLKKEWTEALPLVWEREVGSAFSSFACVDGKTYTCGTQDGQQVLFCLKAATGEVVWQTPIEQEYRERQGGDGTRATPTVDDGRVYVLGALGRLICCDVETGKVIWDKKFTHAPTWGYSGSVLVDGKLAIVSAGQADGALVAFDKASGEQVWKAGNDKVGYATPYPFTFDRTRYIVGFMGESAVIVQAEDGKLVWRMPWKTSWDVNAAAPLFHDGYLLLSSGYGHGAVLLKLRKDGEGLAASTVWEEDAIRNKFQSVVLYKGYIYTCDEQALKCVEFLTGDEKWSVKRTPQGTTMKHGTLVLAEEHLFVLSENGELIICPAKPEGFEPLTRANILSGRCWTLPVLYDGKLYARNLERLVCFDLTAEAAE